MLRSIIIEDEINNRELLNHMLEDYISGIDVVDLVQDVEGAIKSIEKYDPDLIFLDIEIHGGTGFDVLKHFTDPRFKVIFVTGYEHYAIKAIKHSAIDYILKPINLEELKEAVNKIKAQEVTHTANIEYIKTYIESGTEELAHLLISDYNTSDTVLINEIIYLESHDRYTIFYLTESRKRISSLGLSFFETLLNPTTFFRIHRSAIVNCNAVHQVSKGRAAKAVMSNGNTLQVAYRRKAEFLAKLDGNL